MYSETRDSRFRMIKKRMTKGKWFADVPHTYHFMSNESHLYESINSISIRHQHHNHWIRTKKNRHMLYLLFQFCTYTDIDLLEAISLHTFCFGTLLCALFSLSLSLTLSFHCLTRWMLH